MRQTSFAMVVSLHRFIEQRVRNSAFGSNISRLAAAFRWSPCQITFADVRKFTAFAVLFALVSQSTLRLGSANAQDSLQSDHEQLGEYVVATYEDRHGVLWFGTLAYGAARYDGKQLTYVTEDDGLIGNRVVEFAEDKAGNLWIANGGRVSRYDGDAFEHFGPDEGLVGNVVTIMSDRQGMIWAGSFEGAFRYDGDSFIKIDVPRSDAKVPSYKLQLNGVFRIFEDTQGNMWFGTDGNGVFKYDGKSFIQFSKKDGLPNNNVFNIIEDRHGHLWFASIASRLPEETQDGGLSRFDGSTFTVYEQPKGLARNDIYTLFTDSKGNVWIGATYLGVYRFDGSNFKLFDTTNRPDLIKTMGIQSMMEDREGRLWFGLSGGLFRLHGDSLVNVTKQGPWK